MDLPSKFDTKKKFKKREQRFCVNRDGCIYKSYFGSKCMVAKRVIWRTCRFKSKTSGGVNEKD